MDMDLKLAQCFIAVDDHDKALAFYCGVLGLEVRNDVKFEGMRWVTVSSPAQPDVEIVLEPPLADPNAPAADRQAAAELMAKGMMRGVIFRTEEFQNIVPWLMLNREGLDVLVHPLTESSYDDHSKNALWLGTPVPMRLDILRPTYRAELLPTGSAAAV